MKKLCLLSCFCLLFSGCAGGASNAIKQIPKNSFDKFYYSRGGNVTSITILAEDCKKINGQYVIKKVHLNASNPLSVWTIQLEGFKRDLPKEEIDE